MSDTQGAYFQLKTTEVETSSENPPRFVSMSDLPTVTLTQGITAQPVFGGALLLSFVHFEPNAVAPLHQHPEEQCGTVLEGEMEFEVNGERRMMRPGDVYVAPPNVPHQARTYDRPCLALDVFSPPRSGYRELLEAAQFMREGSSRGG
jgi:quercetin dioxygenase-like cupin family protein